MAKYPYMRLWVGDYLADTTHLSVAESGAYLHLLMAAWRSTDAELPDDDAQLARLARCTPREWRRVRDPVMAFWQRDRQAGTWTQNRVVTERQIAHDKSAKAKRAADCRWLKSQNSHDANAYANAYADGSADAMHNPMLQPCPSTVEEDSELSEDSSPPPESSPLPLARSHSRGRGNGADPDPDQPDPDRPPTDPDADQVPH